MLCSNSSPGPGPTLLRSKSDKQKIGAGIPMALQHKCEHMTRVLNLQPYSMISASQRWHPLLLILLEVILNSKSIIRNERNLAIVFEALLIAES